MNYLTSLVINIFVGVFFTAIMGTFFLGPIYVLSLLFGFALSVKWVYGILYVIFILFGYTNVNNKKFSTFRGWHR